MAAGQGCHHPCAQDVGANRFQRLQFHQGDVLVGGRMEHHLGPVFREKTFHQGLVAHIRHAHGEAFGMPRCGQLHLQVVERALGRVDQQQMLRTQGRQLPDQLGPDAPGGTGHQHAPPGEACPHLGIVQPDHRPPQQVLDAHGAHLPGAQLSVDPITDGRHGEHLHAGLHGRVHHPAPMFGVRLLDGHDQLVHRFLTEKLLQPVRMKHDRTLQPFARLAHVIVHEGHHLVAVRAFTLQGALGDEPGLPGAEQDHLHGVLARPS